MAGSRNSEQSKHQKIENPFLIHVILTQLNHGTDFHGHCKDALVSLIEKDTRFRTLTLFVQDLALYKKFKFEEADKIDTFIDNERVKATWYRNLFMIRNPQSQS